MRAHAALLLNRAAFLNAASTGVGRADPAPAGRPRIPPPNSASLLLLISVTDLRRQSQNHNLSHRVRPWHPQNPPARLSMFLCPWREEHARRLPKPLVMTEVVACPFGCTEPPWIPRCCCRPWCWRVHSRPPNRLASAEQARASPEQARPPPRTLLRHLAGEGPRQDQIINN